MALGNPTNITLPGVGKILLTPQGTIAQNNPLYPVLLSFRKAAKFIISEADPVKDFKNGSIPNRDKFNFTTESFITRLSQFQNILAMYRAGGTDAQLCLPERFSGSGNNKVLVFTEAVGQALGLDFVMKKTPKECTTQIVLESIFSKSEMDAILSAANSLDRLHPLFASTQDPLYDSSSITRSSPQLIAYNVGGTYTELFTKGERKTYELTVKSSGDKSEETGRTQPAYVNVEFSVTGRNAELSTLLALRTLPFDLGFKMIDKLSSTLTETYDIKPGALFSNNEFMRGDGNADATITLKWSRDVSIPQMVFSGDTANSVVTINS